MIQGTTNNHLTRCFALALTAGFFLSSWAIASPSSQATSDQPVVVALPAMHDGVQEIALTSSNRVLASAKTSTATATLTTVGFATSRFDVAGLSWPAGLSVGEVKMRAWTSDGWSSWESLDIGPQAGGPDPGSAEADSPRQATEPLVVPGATGLQITVNAAPGQNLPAGLSAMVVAADAGTPEVSPSPQPSATPLPDDSASATPIPSPSSPSPSNPDDQTVERNPDGSPLIHLRKEWGANEKLVEIKNRKPFTTLRGAIVHHTAGGNKYTAEQVPGIINGIMVYHIKSNTWNDIGYNYLVDKYGRIWEGRAGGITANVIGAQASGFNAETFGVSVIGDYEAVPVPEPAMAALRALLVWRLGLAGLQPSDMTTYSHLSGKRSTVIGHQDAKYYSTAAKVWYNQTDCPGKYLYPRLDELRVSAPPNTLADKPFTAQLPSLSASAKLVKPGQNVKLSVSWSGGGQGLSGTVTLQRWNGKAWVSTKDIAVDQGRGQAVVALPSTATLRLRSRVLTEPSLGQIDQNNRWSLPQTTVRVAAKTAKTTPKVQAPGYVAKGSKATLTIQWRQKSAKRPSKVQIQAYQAGQWRTVKNLTIDRKTRLRNINVLVTKSTKYRVIAHRDAVAKGAKRPKSATFKIRVY